MQRHLYYDSTILLEIKYQLFHVNWLKCKGILLKRHLRWSLLLYYLASLTLTSDLARAIQEERKVLIKAMFNAKGLGVDNAKVIGRYLIIDNQKYDFSTIPTNLK